MGNDTVPLQSPGFEWQWQSVKAEFKKGSESRIQKTRIPSRLLN